MTESPAESGPVLPTTLYSLPRRRPRVMVKADLLPSSIVLCMVALLGIPLGWVWSRIAPPERFFVRDAQQFIPLQLESWHRFDDLAIFGLLGLAVGVCTGVAVWLLRERRGPVMMLSACLGGLLGAWVAVKTGIAFGNSHYALSGAPQVGSVIEQAPRLESMWVIVVQPLATALLYGLLAGWNGQDDLGRRLG